MMSLRPAIRISFVLLPVVMVLMFSPSAEGLTMSPKPPNRSAVSPTQADISWSLAPDTGNLHHLRYGPNGSKFTSDGSSNIFGALDVIDIDAASMNEAFMIMKGVDGRARIYRKQSFTQEWQTSGIEAWGPPSAIAAQNSQYAWIGDSSTGDTYRYNADSGSSGLFSSSLTRVWDVDVADGIVWAAGEPVTKVDARGTSPPNTLTSYPTTVRNLNASINRFVSISAFDANHIFTVARTPTGESYLSVSQDGGATWTNANPKSINPVSGTNIHDIKAVGPDEAYAVGQAGFVYRYKAGSWTIYRPTTFDLKALAAPDNTQLMAFGCCKNGTDYYVVSYDGINWSSEVSLPEYTGLSAATSPVPGFGWRGGLAFGSDPGRIYRYGVDYTSSRTDGSTLSTVAFSATGLQQSTSYHAYGDSYNNRDVAASGNFAVTSSGLSIVTPPGLQTSGITSSQATVTWDTSLAADTRLYAAVNQGWNSISTGVTSTINDLETEGDLAHLIATGVPHEIQSWGALGGTKAVASPAPTDIAEAIAMRGLRGFSVGRGFIGKTVDGTSWSYQATPYYLFGVTILDDLHAWAVGADTANITGVVIRTQDGGLTWQTVYSPPVYVREVSAIDLNTIVAVGGTGTIHRSTDSGATWYVASTGTTENLLDVDMSDNLNGWAVGARGTVLRTTDGGITWDSVFAGCTGNDVNAVGSQAANDAWFVGELGLVKHWTGGGTGCAQFVTESGTGAGSNELFAVDSDGINVWIGGQAGFAARKGLTIGTPSPVISGTATTTHSITLTGLAPATPYAFFAQSTMPSGHTVVSGLSTFTTLAPPTLQITPTTLNYAAVEGGSDPAAQSFTLQDQYGSNLGAWTAAKTAGGSWLVFAPSSGASTPGSVSVTPKITGLTSGSYGGQIQVNATAPGVANTPQTVFVNLTITAPPKLVLTPGPNPTLNFTAEKGGPNPAPQSVSVTNGGPGTLNYTQANVGGDAWLQFTSTGSSPYLAPNNIVVSPNTAALIVGTHIGTIRVTGVGAVNDSPQDITVRVTITQAPRLRLSPGPNPTLTFNATQGGADPASQTVTIDNAGGGTIAWTAVTATTWVTFAPASGGNGPTTMTVSPHTGSLTPGSHIAAIDVDAGAIADSPQTITVQFTVAAAPVLSATPTTLNFSAPQGTNPPDQDVSITSCSGAGWTTTRSPGTPWLVIVSGATGPACPGTMKVHVESIGAALTVGIYNGYIDLASAGALPASLRINVRMEVTAPPVLDVSPTTLNFSVIEGTTTPASQSVSIRNTGVGTLNWSADQPAAGWAAITLGPCVAPYAPTVSATAPSTLNVCVDVTGLNPGPYTATFQVQAPGALGSPKTVTVNLTVTADTAAPTVIPGSIEVTTGSDCIANNVYGRIRWSTNEFSDSQIEWSEFLDGGVPRYENTLVRDVVDTVNHTGGVTDHEILLDGSNGIVGGHTYYFRFGSKDRFGNEMAWIDRDPPGSPTYLNFVAPAACDADPPVNVVLAVPPSPLFGIVTLNMSAEDASGISAFELYGSWSVTRLDRISVIPGNCNSTGTTFTCTASYSFDTTAAPDGTHSMFVRAFDNGAPLSADSPAVNVTIDNAVPTVSNVQADAYNVSGVWYARITWDTDKASDSRVDYGREDPSDGSFSYDQNVVGNDASCTDCAGGLKHQTALPGSNPPLLSGQRYHFQVKSCALTNPLLCGS